MEITFISPYEDITAYPVRLLSAILREKGHSSKIIFMPTILDEAQSGISQQCIDSVAAVCRDSDVVGFSFFSCHFDAVKQLTMGLKKTGSPPILWGGKHISAQLSDAVGFADFVAVGEGDVTLPLFMDRFPDIQNSSEFPGIWIPEKNSINTPVLPALVQDLDNLPFPDYSLENHYIWTGDDMIKMDEDLQQEYWFSTPEGEIAYQTMGSRGCPHSCSYCVSYKKFYKNQRYLRFRSHGNIIDEMNKMIGKYPFIRSILLSDDNFFAQKETIIEQFAKEYKNKIGLPFRCLAHPDTITREKMRLLTDAGMYQIQIGIQTGSSRTQSLYKRGPASDKIIQTTKIINEFKDTLLPFYDFIIDNPFETNEDLIETLKMIIEFPKPYRLNVFSLLFLPGTELYEKAIKKGINFDLGKEFVICEKKYLNFIFLVTKLPLPKWVLRLFISKPIVSILDNKLIGSLLFGLKDWIKKNIPVRKL